MTTLSNQLNDARAVFTEEMQLLELRSGGVTAEVGSAIDTLTSAMQKAYPKADKHEVSGIVMHHVGVAMREVRSRVKQ